MSILDDDDIGYDARVDNDAYNAWLLEIHEANLHTQLRNEHFNRVWNALASQTTKLDDIIYALMDSDQPNQEELQALVQQLQDLIEVHK